MSISTDFPWISMDIFTAFTEATNVVHYTDGISRHRLIAIYSLLSQHNKHYNIFMFPVPTVI